MSILVSSLIGGSPVSIQTLNASLSGDGTLYQSFSISAVDVNKSIVLAAYAPGGGSNFALYAPQLFSSTEVRMHKKYNTVVGIRDITVTVIDLGTMVKSVQRGMAPPGTNTIAISAVNPAKSIVLLNKAYAGSAAIGPYSTAVLSGATTLTLSNDSYADRYWQVVEFY